MGEEKLHVAGERQAPTGNFLGLLLKNLAVRPFPEGTVFVIMDADKPENMVTLALGKVTAKRLEFTCACGDPQCSLLITFAATRQGHHRASPVVR